MYTTRVQELAPRWLHPCQTLVVCDARLIRFMEDSALPDCSTFHLFDRPPVLTSHQRSTPAAQDVNVKDKL